MAMSKDEKNARARERYRIRKMAAEGLANYNPATFGRKAPRRGIVVSGPLRYPTVKHGARYGGEGNQIGMIGPPRKYKKGAAKPPAAKVGTAPKMVRKAVARVASPGPKKMGKRAAAKALGWTPPKKA